MSFCYTCSTRGLSRNIFDYFPNNFNEGNMLTTSMIAIIQIVVLYPLYVTPLSDSTYDYDLQNECCWQ